MIICFSSDITDSLKILYICRDISKTNKLPSDQVSSIPGEINLHYILTFSEPLSCFHLNLFFFFFSFSLPSFKFSPTYTIPTSLCNLSNLRRVQNLSGFVNYFASCFHPVKREPDRRHLRSLRKSTNLKLASRWKTSASFLPLTSPVSIFLILPFSS